MPLIRQNRLVPILGIVAAVVVGGILMKGRSSGVQDKKMTAVPLAPGKSPDADSPSDTIRTLTAEVSGVKNENRKLRDENAALGRQTEELGRNRREIEESVARKLTEQFSRPEAGGSPAVAGLNAKVDNLAALVERLVPGAGASMGNAPGPAVAAAGSGIPAGLGFESGAAPATLAMNGPALASYAPAGGGGVPAGAIVWTEPLGSRAVPGPNGQVQLVKTALDPSALNTQTHGSVNEGGSGSTAMAGGQADSPPPSIPYFTIPENAVLMDSTAMTALIGRVPVGGNVRDPMEFKVLIGKVNLAANGLEVPDDVTGMVVSGVAVGDWMLSCVEGHINSVTFLFQDGTVKTVSKRSAGGGGGGGSAGQSASRLGYITDERGAACINGTKVTNAPAYLTQIVGIKSLEIAARSVAMAQTTTVASAQGSTTAVTGDQNKFVMGQAAAAGIDEVSNWLMKRLNDSFDAIYVKPGLRVAVHMNEAINLDKDANARKLHYGRQNRSAAARSAHAQLD